MTHREECAAVQVLVPWAAAADLSPADRERVEEHVAHCAGCAALLAFARETALHAQGDPDGHPAAAELVSLVEEPARLAPARQREMTAHLAACRPCRAAVAALRRVDGDLAPGGESPPAVPEDAPADAPAGPPAGTRDDAGGGTAPHHGHRLHFRWLVPALVGAALTLLVTGRRATPPTGGPAVLPVVVLDDATAAARGPAAPESVPRLAADRGTALLLEFTSLAAPPAPGDHFRVQVLAGRDGSAVREWTVTGALFRDNDTLLLTLPPGTLPPGDYRVAVTGPGGDVVYRSRFRVE